ncbi:hypothetical protein TWF192_009900 [Orbilia oligospora]|uniref:Secreted protein n=1 Tax=Orbilia oligospora TaxID=2813651 RepID=A0A6G1MJ22_ORBOL|nr:hypothetical protein TWF679_010727 [Orbilia oligospora]KAF3260619.1 hypothetical protein TWF192_009900 [Orbilia oligospora]
MQSLLLLALRLIEALLTAPNKGGSTSSHLWTPLPLVIGGLGNSFSSFLIAKGGGIGTSIRVVFPIVKGPGSPGHSSGRFQCCMVGSLHLSGVIGGVKTAEVSRIFLAVEAPFSGKTTSPGKTPFELPAIDSK